MRFVLLMALSVATACRANELQVFREQVLALQYTDAAKTAELVSQLEGLSQADARDFYLHLGIMRGALRDAAGARDAFLRALVIDPNASLPGKQSPRIATPFAEALAQVRTDGSLTLVTRTERAADGAWVVEASPVNDRLALVAALSLSVVEDGAERVVEQPPSRPVRLEGKGARVQAMWKLLSARRWVLAAGTVDVPRPAPREVAPKPQQPEAQPATIKVVTPAARPWVPAGVLFGVGVLATGFGAIALGLAGDRAREASRATTWDALQAALKSGRSDQLVGGVVLGLGLAAAATGLTLFGVALFANPEQPMSVTPVVTDGAALISVQGPWP